MCCALIMNSWVAAIIRISWRAAFSVGSLLAPVFRMVATTSLSTYIQKYFPLICCFLVFSAITTASISSCAMFIFCIVVGKLPCIYSFPQVAPYPLGHASVAISWSGCGTFVSHIMEMPLYCSRNLPHHARSFLASVGMLCLPFLGNVLSHCISLEMNVLPGLIHLLANCNFPMMLSSSFLVVVVLVFHVLSSASISFILSWVTSIFIVFESKVTSRNSILVVGGMFFLGAVSTLRVSSSWVRWLYAAHTFSSSAPKKSST